MTSSTGWPLLFCKEDYLPIFKSLSFRLHDYCGEWEGWFLKFVNHANWQNVVIPTGHSKYVQNRCVIELLGAWRFCVVALLFVKFPLV